MTVFQWLPVLADSATSGMEAFAPLLNIGAVGGVLIWFMTKAEPRMKRIEQAIDRATLANMVFLMGIKGIPEHVQREAEKIKAEIETRHGKDD